MTIPEKKKDDVVFPDAILFLQDWGGFLVSENFFHGADLVCRGDNPSRQMPGRNNTDGPHMPFDGICLHGIHMIFLFRKS